MQDDTGKGKGSGDLCSAVYSRVSKAVTELPAPAAAAWGFQATKDVLRTFKGPIEETFIGSEIFVPHIYIYIYIYIYICIYIYIPL